AGGCPRLRGREKAPLVAATQAQHGRSRRARRRRPAPPPARWALASALSRSHPWCPKNNFTSGIRGPAFSMAVLRIRRRLPAGLNGQGRQMFVIVNKFCGLDGRRSFGAVQLAAVLIRIRAFHTTGFHWLIEGPDEQSSPPRRCRGGLYHALSIRNRFGAMI